MNASARHPYIVSVAAAPSDRNVLHSKLSVAMLRIWVLANSIDEAAAEVRSLVVTPDFPWILKSRICMVDLATPEHNFAQVATQQISDGNAFSIVVEPLAAECKDWDFNQISQQFAVIDPLSTRIL